MLGVLVGRTSDVLLGLLCPWPVQVGRMTVGFGLPFVVHITSNPFWWMETPARLLNYVQQLYISFADILVVADFPPSNSTIPLTHHPFLLALLPNLEILPARTNSQIWNTNHQCNGCINVPLRITYSCRSNSAQGSTANTTEIHGNNKPIPILLYQLLRP